MNEDMDPREKDIQALAKAVIDNAISWEYEAYDRWCCIFCREDLIDFNNRLTTTEANEQLKHSPNCAYLIAKDLSTGVETK